jgi:hydrogenase large subunit
MASIRSVEDAIHRAVPPNRANAEIIRNLMIAAQYVHDHVMHFYHLHALDWVDVVSALSADPKATSTLAQSISSYPKSSPGYFADVQKRAQDLRRAGPVGHLRQRYWGHPAYKLPPEANLMAVAHYLEALAWQRDVVKLHAIFGGKNPHPTRSPSRSRTPGTTTAAATRRRCTRRWARPARTTPGPSRRTSGSTRPASTRG